MNGLSVGSTVGVGTVIATLVSGIYLPPIEVVACFLFYGLVAGLIFEVYKWALQGVRFPPWRT